MLRGKATEPAGVRKASGGFDDVFDKGTYVCAGAGGWVSGSVRGGTMALEEHCPRCCGSRGGIYSTRFPSWKCLGEWRKRELMLV